CLSGIGRFRLPTDFFTAPELAAIPAFRTAGLAHHNRPEPRFPPCRRMHSALVPKVHCLVEGTAMSFAIYIVGFLILIGGLIYGAVILHVAAHWIAVGAIVLLGLAILKGVQATRGKDPSH
ncbi:MAG: hypothetical protein WBL65_13505, partial [Bryobacteraceae bacterium]